MTDRSFEETAFAPLPDGEDQAAVQTLLRQQATLARFGELALRSQNLTAILQEACRLVGEALGTDLAKVMELEEDGTTLLVKAEVGWPASIVGQVRISALQGSPEAHALRTGEPVVSNDIARETRFVLPGLLAENGVQAMALVVIIGGGDRAPYGILQVDSRTTRDFTGRDVAFLRTYANLLAAAVDRLRVLNEATRERDLLWSVSDDLLLVSDAKGRVLKVSPSWTRLLGRSEADLVDGGYVNVIHPDDYPTVKEAVRRLQETRMPVSFEGRVQSRDEVWRWISWKLSPELDGGGLTGIGRDISANRERDTALRDQEDFTRLALTSVGGVGVWTYDAMTDRFTCDAAISELYGLDAARGAKGLESRDFLANVHPEDLLQLRAVMARGVEREGDLELEYRILHPDGSTRWVLSRAHNYLDETGKPLRRTGVGIETTKQRQIEEQLRQSQKMEAVGQLTGGVAHDFNNLLTVIRSSIDLLKRPNLSEERRRRYIEAISDTTTRAAKLTGQLLAFARRQALRPEVFDVAESVKAIGDMVVTLTGARIRIETRVPDSACFINADPSQFDTAMINLVVNARDAMEGEGVLSITVDPVPAIPSLRSHPAIIGDFVQVSITDTGSGIPTDMLDKIFDPFFTTKDVGKGTGLGLSQVFGFVKQTGGDVGVVSELGHGTAFSLYLPRCAVAEPTKATQASVAPLVDGHGTCVLVVEDNADVGSFAAQTLEELGYDPVLAVNAEAALTELASGAGRFDVVFSDIVMPGMNGIDLAREIRRLYPDLPVVLTSGYSHILAQDGTHGFELLQKPYSIEQLSRILTKAAHWRRLKRVLDGEV